MKRSALKRKPWRRALGTSEQRLAFKYAVLEADGHQCIMRGKFGYGTWNPNPHDCDGPLECAHIIRKHTLRKRGYGADVVYSPDSSFTLCRAHHQLHDSYALRVPFDLIPERCRRFAARIERERAA